MTGFDELGADDPNYVGFDYMSLLKGAGGVLSAASGGGGGGGGPSAQEQAYRMAQAQQAEKSARTMKFALIGVVAAVGLGGLAFLVLRKPAA